MTRNAVPSPTRPARGDGGFTLIEVCIALVILVVAVLGHMASVSASHRSAQDTEAHALALQTLERFVERLREDPDWETLWARLESHSVESTADTTLSSVGTDLALPTGSVTSFYGYTDFLVPSQLSGATFLVQVPVSDNGGIHELRENLNAPRYGLPYDLNGDGLVDSTPRASTDPAQTTTDYRQLPVVVRVRWGGPGRMQDEVTLSTWLRGDR